ncbi:MAG: hypothetical protein Q8J89_10590 [Caulobacter sp.]|nr:hypothetical protein [Caulobacter sp.]
MVFERATPPALRWVVAFLAVCAALGLWLGFKDQIRRNPPAWYTGAPDPATPVAPPGDATIRDATAFDPNAPTQAAAPAPLTRAQPKAAEPDDAGDAVDAPPAPMIAPPILIPPVQPPAAQPAPPRPRPAPPPPPVARPTPSEDPVGDLLDPPAQSTPPVPY